MREKGAKGRSMRNPIENAVLEAMRSKEIESGKPLDQFLDTLTNPEWGNFFDACQGPLDMYLRTLTNPNLRNFFNTCTELAEIASSKLEDRAVARDTFALMNTLSALNDIGVDWSNVDIGKTISTGKLTTKGLENTAA